MKLKHTKIGETTLVTVRRGDLEAVIHYNPQGQISMSANDYNMAAGCHSVSIVDVWNTRWGKRSALRSALRALRYLRCSSPQSIVVVSRTWFDKINGNTYYSGRAYVDGEQAAAINFSHGHGSQIEHDLFRSLSADRIIPEWDGGECPQQFCHVHGISLAIVPPCPVSRKSDLQGW